MASNSAYTRASMAIPDWALRWTGRLNVPVYRLTRGRVFGRIGTIPVLLLTTTGRKSGQKRTAPVVFLPDGEDLIVIGSNAGNSRPPAWSLNLVAYPEAEVEVRAARRSVRARVAEGAERERLWAKMADEYEGFERYSAATDRKIDLFVLEPR